jgi:hypothetical protein
MVVVIHAEVRLIECDSHKENAWGGKLPLEGKVTLLFGPEGAVDNILIVYVSASFGEDHAGYRDRTLKPLVYDVDRNVHRFPNLCRIGENSELCDWFRTVVFNHRTESLLELETILVRRVRGATAAAHVDPRVIPVATDVSPDSSGNYEKKQKHYTHTDSSSKHRLPSF